MSKLLYPVDGMYKYCQVNTLYCSSNLSYATSNCNFDVPSGFSYKSYLDGLGSTITNYHKESVSIDNKIQETDNNYNILDSDLTEEAQKMVSSKITERERMIV